MKSLVLLLGVVAAIFLTGCTKGAPPQATLLETATDELNSRFPVTIERAFLLNNHIGAINVKWSGSEDTVRWTLHRRVTGRSREEAHLLLSFILLLQQYLGDTTRFFPEPPSTVVGYTFAMDITMALPYRMPCIVDGVSGPVSVADVGADLIVRNVHAVTVRRLNASCDISSMDGGVDAEVAIPPGGSCVIRAEQGTIVLKIPSNTSAVVTVQAANGTITHNGLTFTQLNQQQGSLTGTLGAGNGQIHLEALQGNIVLQGVLP